MPAPSKTPRAKSAKPASKGPSEVAPGLFVGGWNDALTFEGARFCVLDEAPEELPPEAKHIPIYDEGSGRANRSNLDRLAQEAGAARATGRPVLVFCGHGIRRSPLAAAWILHRTERLPLDQAYDRIRAVRPRVEVPTSWMGSPQSLEGA
jgi:hypothetical protein